MYVNERPVSLVSCVGTQPHFHSPDHFFGSAKTYFPQTVSMGGNEASMCSLLPLNLWKLFCFLLPFPFPLFCVFQLPLPTYIFDLKFHYSICICTLQSTCKKESLQLWNKQCIHSSFTCALPAWQALLQFQFTLHCCLYYKVFLDNFHISSIWFLVVKCHVHMMDITWFVRLQAKVLHLKIP